MTNETSNITFGRSKKANQKIRFGESKKANQKIRFGESKKANQKIRFGPAGLGPVKDAIEHLEYFSNNGLRACEIAFTYGVYIKKEEDFEEIKKTAENFGIKLSIHAQYWINLNSKEEEKVKASKKRILACCEAGHKLGAKNIVFHPGFYAGMDKVETYQNIKNAILDIQKRIKNQKWDVKLCPETTGKVNVFGSLAKIAIKETKIALFFMLKCLKFN